MTREEAFALAKRAGLNLYDKWSVKVHEDRVVFEYTEALTFEALARLSEAFGTKRIDLGIEEGCASDPSCDPYIIVWGRFE